MSAPYQVTIENIYEGPMDLLVHLIRKNELDIYDIPIALITEQYLAYIEWMKIMNIDFAGDFLVMAATLTQIKSKMLLPVHEGEEDEDEDPRMEIVRPLAEYLQMKQAAAELGERNLLGEHTFTRTPDYGAIPADGDMIHVGLFELIDAFKKILDNVTDGYNVEISQDRISVKEKITELTDLLVEKGSLTFEELFPEHPDKTDIIISFLAILEMVKIKLARIFQSTQTGIIRLFCV